LLVQCGLKLLREIYLYRKRRGRHSLASQALRRSRIG
jgi:hypothetical protein